jgi:hypothetical protein
VHIDAVTYTIIGVAPDEFVGLWPYRPPAAFVPVATFAANRATLRVWSQMNVALQSQPRAATATNKNGRSERWP